MRWIASKPSARVKIRGIVRLLIRLAVDVPPQSTSTIALTLVLLTIIQSNGAAPERARNAENEFMA